MACSCSDHYRQTLPRVSGQYQLDEEVYQHWVEKEGQFTLHKAKGKSKERVEKRGEREWEVGRGGRGEGGMERREEEREAGEGVGGERPTLNMSNDWSTNSTRLETQKCDIDMVNTYIHTYIHIRYVCMNEDMWGERVPFVQGEGGREDQSPLSTFQGRGKQTHPGM